VGEHFGDGRGVGDYAHGALHTGKVATGDNGRRLVVDTALEAGGAPVDELDGALGLGGGDSGVGILGNDVTTVHETASIVTGIALRHHAGGLEVNSGVGDKVGLELSHINVEGAIETKGGDEGRDNLGG